MGRFGTQRYFLNKIARIKWGRTLQHFKCSKCGNSKINKRKFPVSLKCTKCTAIHGTLVGTAFENGKIKISIKVAILEEFAELFPERPTLKELAQKFKVSEKSVEGFIKKVASYWDVNGPFDEKDFWSTDNDSETVFHEDYIFFKNLNSKSSKDIYYCIYWLYFWYRHDFDDIFNRVVDINYTEPELDEDDNEAREMFEYLNL